MMSSTSGIYGMPGTNTMADPLEFVRNMWGAMKIPGMSMPSMSPDEINKQIADLKAVESWLQLNMNMLRSSIQALEIQSATLSTLQTMGQNFAQAVKPQEDAPKPSPFTAGPPFESPFSSFSQSAETDQQESQAASADASAPAADAAAMAAQFVNPAAWWNVVQDQFTQAVGSAMAPAKKPARKSAKSSTAKKKAAPRSSSGNAASTHAEEAKPPVRKKPAAKKAAPKKTAS